jgi:hypothetical protein
MDRAGAPADFFAMGTDTSCVSDCASCCCDLRRFACNPSPCSSPTTNALDQAIKNCFCGAAEGIWYRKCCCCVPCKSFDYLCFCCKKPEDRCASCLFWGARTLWSGTIALDRLYPNAGSGDAPSADAPANKFVSWFESFGTSSESRTATSCSRAPSLLIRK